MEVTGQKIQTFKVLLILFILTTWILLTFYIELKGVWRSPPPSPSSDDLSHQILWLRTSCEFMPDEKIKAQPSERSCPQPGAYPEGTTS